MRAITGNGKINSHRNSNESLCSFVSGDVSTDGVWDWVVLRLEPAGGPTTAALWTPEKVCCVIT